ncbi:hypothetical protein QAD02_015542 [Eretmocerus hayati]|uniref:Uncharacterized protein n=1 Tax=Eretmocerus hayati TaxID=131215 RepID=A0ACC2PDA6_9HYME|nr:hypothetical protein QAD02_015542 [Eretmocerus hayati]
MVANDDVATADQIVAEPAFGEAEMIEAGATSAAARDASAIYLPARRAFRPTIVVNNAVIQGPAHRVGPAALAHSVVEDDEIAGPSRRGGMTVVRSPTLPHDDAEEMRAPTPQAVINAPSSTSASTSMQPTAVVTSQNDGNPRSTENIMSNVANDADVTIVAQTADKDNREIELDDDALRVLGVAPSKPLESKNPLRPELTVRWTVWKSDGLDDDTKKELLDKYVPDTTLAAQKLNPELLSILSEAAIKRDSHIESNQKLTGTALTALGSAVSSLLTCKNYSRVKLLETLHDTGKILSELHHEQLESRKACILPITNKNMKSVLEKAKPDEYLFGSNLSDKIKEAKVMEKVGNDLKSVPIKKPFNKNNFRNPQKKIAPDQNQSNYKNQTNTQKKSSIPRRQTRSQTSRNRPDTRKR